MIRCTVCRVHVSGSVFPDHVRMHQQAERNHRVRRLARMERRSGVYAQPVDGEPLGVRTEIRRLAKTQGRFRQLINWFRERLGMDSVV